MKNNYAWTKTLLTVYRYLERITGAIDKIIMQSALNSSNISGQNYFYNNVYAISEKIINLSERKVTLINLKILVDDILKVLPQKEASLLIGKYIDGLKCKILAEKCDMSVRSAFRKIDSAVSSFAKKLSAKGYTDSVISKMVEKEGWIINCYERYSADKEEVALSKVFLAKAVSM